MHWSGKKGRKGPMLVAVEGGGDSFGFTVREGIAIGGGRNCVKNDRKREEIRKPERERRKRWNGKSHARGKRSSEEVKKRERGASLYVIVRGRVASSYCFEKERSRSSPA